MGKNKDTGAQTPKDQTTPEQTEVKDIKVNDATDSQEQPNGEGQDPEPKVDPEQNPTSKPQPAKAKADPAPKANMASTSLKDIGKRLLNQYPHKDVMYVSSDGTGFFSEDDAIRHANTLNDKIVVTVKR